MDTIDHVDPAPPASSGSQRRPLDILRAFAGGLTTREDAVSALGLRDYAELLVALGEHDLAPPRPTEHEVELQAVEFERVWSSA
jgi:hypothetical protein